MLFDAIFICHIFFARNTQSDSPTEDFPKRLVRSFYFAKVILTLFVGCDLLPEWEDLENIRSMKRWKRT